MKRRMIDSRLSRRSVLLGTVVLTAMAVAAQGQLPRTWTDSSGRFSVKATFISEADGIVSPATECCLDMPTAKKTRRWRCGTSWQI